jgi:predicted N-acetyltransferase YhbS
MLRLKVIDTADVPAVLALQSQCYGPEFLESAQAFEAKLSATRGLHCSYLACEGDEALGYVVSLPVQAHSLPALDALQWTPPVQPDMLYLHDLAVAPAGRAKRLGHKLVQQVLQRAQDMGLTRVGLVAVQASQDFWRRHGFAETQPQTPALREKLASFGAQARFMERAVVPA